MLARTAARCVAPLRLAAGTAVRASSTSTQQPGAPADALLPRSATSVRAMYHYTSYFLVGGVPAALLMGQPVSSVLDVAMSVMIPLHFHIGMRSVLVDYVHEPTAQAFSLNMLAGATVLTALGIAKFNLTDVGLTQGVVELFVEQAPPKGKASMNPY